MRIGLCISLVLLGGCGTGLPVGGRLDVNANLRNSCGGYANTDPDILDASEAALGVVFDARVTGADARAYKPDPKVFETARERLDVEPGRWLYVSAYFEYDLEPAREMGIQTVWVNRAGGESTAKGDYEIASLAELPAIVS